VNPQTDILVVGAGAAGIAAAVSAARSGCATLLLDQRPAAGGTGGFSGLTTLCGLYDDAGNYLNEGFVREFAKALGETAPLRMGKVWVLQYRPERFRELAARLIATTPELQARWNSPIADVIVEGPRVVQLNGVRVGAVIDCSGTAEVAGAIGAECLATDETTQAAAIVFPLCHVTRELKTAAEVAQVLLPLVRADFPPLNLQPSLEPNTLTAKFTGSAKQVGPLIEFLRTHVKGFENCATPVTEFAPARRAGRMIVGQYLLTGEDVLAGRKFPDAVARCAWPIEQWGVDGVARFRYLPAGAYYEIPARSLRAAKVENLFMAGKTISADVDVIASARVMGCCLATGAAAGQLAATFVQSARTR
jgi:FAD dependent oxidoreductase